MKKDVIYQIIIMRDLETQVIPQNDYHYGKEAASRLQFFLKDCDIIYQQINRNWTKEDEDGCPIDEEVTEVNLEF